MFEEEDELLNYKGGFALDNAGGCKGTPSSLSIHDPSQRNLYTAL